MVESQVCLNEFEFGETAVTMTGFGVVNIALKKPSVTLHIFIKFKIFSGVGFLSLFTKFEC